MCARHEYDRSVEEGGRTGDMISRDETNEGLTSGKLSSWR